MVCIITWYFQAKDLGDASGQELYLNEGVIENLSADSPNQGRSHPASVEKAANTQSRNFHESELGGGYSWGPGAGMLIAIWSRTVVCQDTVCCHY